MNSSPFSGASPPGVRGSRPGARGPERCARRTARCPFAGQAFPAEGVYSIQGSDLLARDQPILDEVHERTTNLPWIASTLKSPGEIGHGLEGLDKPGMVADWLVLWFRELTS
jgi:hypothetical protein